MISFELMHTMVRLTSGRLEPHTDNQSSSLLLIQADWPNNRTRTHAASLSLNADRSLLESALYVFQCFTKSIRPAVRRSARIGAETLRLMIESQRNLEAFPGNNESFVHALKRITKSVQKEQQELDAAITSDINRSDHEMHTCVDSAIPPMSADCMDIYSIPPQQEPSNFESWLLTLGDQS